MKQILEALEEQAIYHEAYVSEHLLCANHKAAYSWECKDSWFPQKA